MPYNEFNVSGTMKVRGYSMVKLRGGTFHGNKNETKPGPNGAKAGQNAQKTGSNCTKPSPSTKNVRTQKGP